MDFRIDRKVLGIATIFLSMDYWRASQLKCFSCASSTVFPCIDQALDWIAARVNLFRLAIVPCGDIWSMIYRYYDRPFFILWCESYKICNFFDVRNHFPSMFGIISSPDKYSNSSRCKLCPIHIVSKEVWHSQAMTSCFECRNEKEVMHTRSHIRNAPREWFTRMSTSWC